MITTQPDIKPLDFSDLETAFAGKTKGELNQEFYDKVLGPDKATDRASFETELTQIMKQNYANESDFLLSFDIDKVLLDTINIELPFGAKFIEATKPVS